MANTIFSDDKTNRRARAFVTLQRLAGYVADGSDTTVTISQDDATRSWLVRAGSRAYYGPSLYDALEEARADIDRLDREVAS